MGESQIAKFGLPVEHVYLEPERVPAYPGAVHALLDADLILLGPGSLYTSLLPNLLIDDICAAAMVSPAAKLFVCNVRDRARRNRWLHRRAISCQRRQAL